MPGILKQYFMDRKALAIKGSTPEHQAMLQRSDTEIVKDWLEKALRVGGELGVTAKVLAKECDVTVQAVNGWLRTGRITKKNLEIATKVVGYGPSFVEPSSMTVVREPRFGEQTWPFRTVRREEVLRLSRQQLARLERTLRSRIDELIEDAGGAQNSSEGKRRQPKA